MRKIFPKEHKRTKSYIIWRIKHNDISYTEDNKGMYYICLDGEITATLPKNIDHYELVDVIQNFVLDYDAF